MIWSEFVAEYSKLIARSAKNRLYSYGLKACSEEIEDITQDVLFSIWRGKKLRMVKDRVRLPYWISIVSGNAALDYMRQTRTQKSKEYPLSECDDETLECTPLNMRRNLSPDFLVHKKDIIVALESSISDLPAREKMVAKLFIIHGKKLRDIADIMHIPFGTVTTISQKVKAKLRVSLKHFKDF